MKRYIASVSGGPDSMALLDKYRSKIAVVCHVNYHKRDTSDRDMKIVKEYCKKHHITFECLECSTKLYAKYKDSSNNFQTVARLIRYDFFLKVAKQNQIFNLLVAHNLNDFLETAYMQRDKNSRSLFYGIKKHNVYANALKVSRPLIKVKKIKLQDYCDKNGVDYELDESNFTNVYQRNVTRKIINTYTSINLRKFYAWIKHYNRKNAYKVRKIDRAYKKWTKEAFDCRKFFYIKESLRYYVVYNWLINYGMLGSESKINGIIDFIKKGDVNKTYRLENDSLIRINKNKTMIIEK